MGKRRSGSSKIEERAEGWIGEELRGCQFQDARHWQASARNVGAVFESHRH